MTNPITYERYITAGSAAGTTEKGIRVSNGCFARQFGTSNWSRIRLGMRYRFLDVNGTGLTSVSGVPRFSFGFCSGTDNIPGDQSWDSWVSMTSVASSWTISILNSYINMYTSTTYNMWLHTGSNYSITDLNNGIGTFGLYDWNTAFYSAYETSSLGMVFLDLHKQSGTDEVFRYSMFGRYTTTAVTEYVSDVDFQTQLQSLSPSYTNYLYRDYSTSPSYNFSSSVLTYPLNSVFVYVDRSDPVLEITDLYVVRLA